MALKPECTETLIHSVRRWYRRSHWANALACNWNNLKLAMLLDIKLFIFRITLFNLQILHICIGQNEFDNNKKSLPQFFYLCCWYGIGGLTGICPFGEVSAGDVSTSSLEDLLAWDFWGQHWGQCRSSFIFFVEPKQWTAKRSSCISSDQTECYKQSRDRCALYFCTRT